MACSVTINLPILISAVLFILSLDANNALIKYTIKLKNNQTGVLNSSSLTNFPWARGIIRIAVLLVSVS